MNTHATEALSPILVYRCQVPAWADRKHLLSGLAKIPAPLHGEITCFRRLQDQLARLVARRLISKALVASGLEQFGSLCHWQKDPLGRPFIEACCADISISHSESWVVGALALHARVGVDIETFRSILLDSLHPYLSDSERARVESAVDPHREAIKCWSLREAILKADGRGLLAPEDVIRDIWRLEKPQGGKWRIENFDSDQTCIYLATDQDEASIVHKDWAFQDLLK
jgi:4'-phosphopantetheinyl transferase